MVNHNAFERIRVPNAESKQPPPKVRRRRLNLQASKGEPTFWNHLTSRLSTRVGSPEQTTASGFYVADGPPVEGRSDRVIRIGFVRMCRASGPGARAALHDRGGAQQDQSDL
jgi:hypothetical protein